MAKVGRPRKIENYFNPVNSNRQFTEGQKSKGILADDVTRTVIRAKEGTIEHTPIDDKDIVNKEYADPIEMNITGNSLSGADGSINRILTLSNTTLTRNPVIVFVEGQMITPSDLTVSHLITSSTITFSINIYDLDKIRVIAW